MITILEKNGKQLTIKEGSTIYNCTVEGANPEVIEALHEQEKQKPTKKSSAKKTTTKKKQTTQKKKETTPKKKEETQKKE